MRKVTKFIDELSNDCGCQIQILKRKMFMKNCDIKWRNIKTLEKKIYQTETYYIELGILFNSNAT